MDGKSAICADVVPLSQHSDSGPQHADETDEPRGMRIPRVAAVAAAA